MSFFHLRGITVQTSTLCLVYNYKTALGIRPMMMCLDKMIQENRPFYLYKGIYIPSQPVTW